MPSKKPRLTQAQKAASSDLAKLKKLGLFKGNVRRPSRYAVKKSKDYQDVLKGKAAIVTAPKTTIAREYKQQFKTYGKKIIIPKAKNERWKFDKKEQAITSTRRAYGAKIKATIKPGEAKRVASAGVPKGKKIRYVIPFNRGALGTDYLRFDDWDSLAKFMAEYERYKDWQQYVQYELVDTE